MADILPPQLEQLSSEKIVDLPRITAIENEISSIKQQATADGKLMYGPDGKFEYALAPNGERSHLTEKQWIQTRTTAFKKWFGDWEQDRENSSKVVDENGEPLVIYHGTSRTFDTFDANAPKTFGEMDNTKDLFYATSGKKFATEQYAEFKKNLVADILRDFNSKFFSGKETEWRPLINKWNEFIRSIGTERVNFNKKVPDGRGGYWNWTVVEFDGKTIFNTDEIDKLWDKKLPSIYKEEDYEIENWNGTEILLPKNSKPIVMELFINSRDPIYKEMRENAGPQEMDNIFSNGLIEKGINPDPKQKHIEESPNFGLHPTADSIIVQASKSGFALGFFQANQAKSAIGNNGTFSSGSINIFE